MKVSHLACAIIVLAGLFFFSCEYKNYAELHPSSSNCDTAATTNYSQDIVPILNNSCGTSSCHDGSAITKLNNYTNVVNAAKSGALYGSIIHDSKYMAMPKGGGQLSVCEIRKIKRWIDGGMPDGGAPTPCDTSKAMSYKNDVLPILKNSCSLSSCHSTAGGGTILDTYNDVANSAKSGSLYGTIAHNSGFMAMPKGSDKLSTCEIRKIARWIKEGAKNN